MHVLKWESYKIMSYPIKNVVSIRPAKTAGLLDDRKERRMWFTPISSRQVSGLVRMWVSLRLRSGDSEKGLHVNSVQYFILRQSPIFGVPSREAWNQVKRAGLAPARIRTRASAR